MTQTVKIFNTINTQSTAKIFGSILNSKFKVVLIFILLGSIACYIKASLSLSEIKKKLIQSDEGRNKRLKDEKVKLVTSSKLLIDKQSSTILKREDVVSVKRNLAFQKEMMKLKQDVLKNEKQQIIAEQKIIDSQIEELDK